MKLMKKIFITGEVEARTGLHIGSKNLGLSIGSTDNTVIRHPVTQEPYIPGSSLRGKMRCLLERYEGLMGDKMSDEVKRGPYVNDKNNYICSVFGIPAEKAKEFDTPPSRLIVRDGLLLKESADKLKDAKNTDMPFTEVKTEVVIDRVTSAAMPRQIERVPAGAIFSLNMVLNIWDEDKDRENDFIQAIFQGLKLLQDDYLGGHGSRGSGKVKINLDKLTERTLENYKKGEKPTERSDKIPDELSLEDAHASA